MIGWLLYKRSPDELPADAYEVPRFLEVAAQQGIELHVLKPEQFDLIVTRDDRKSVILDGRVTPLPDFLLPRMGAGTTYFALSIIRHLERLGVQVINSSQSIESVKDKLYTQQILAASKLPVPKTMLVRFPVNSALVEKQLGFPVVIKTLSGSMGSGVYLSNTRAEFENMVSFVESTNPNSSIILQEFIADSRGRDLRVIVIGGRAVATMQRSASDGDFRANISRGGAASAYPMTPEIELLALEVVRTLGLDVAGVDLLFDGDHFKVCEVNSSPMFQGIESCHEGLNVAEEIFRYVRVRLGRYEGLHGPQPLPANGLAPKPEALP